ncbi:DUF4349 domain-containing protein [Lederbergia citrea]|uniref:DUF4349 domain-containing protein n=1 Tax=Lederbergia citrea TaxID=2833581 RepID=A0A942UNR3_9BACI|nr:DUF4349 domain-containing protein [Lederbergia citrea]MBS4204131.1 DUF4349 domain-containing protein [Lederbergia citrea]MBS4221284.1 DUF4349 domain-containing protein [Lederbergia citrea]
MKRQSIFILLLSSLFVLMAACSSSDLSESGKSDSAGSNEIAMKSEMDQSTAEDSVEEKSGEINTNRMIIHQANLQVNVKNLEKAQLKIEKKVNEYGGYIVESNVYRENDETVSGRIMVRVPEKYFQKFLTDAEEEAINVLERNVTGQDVTEEYVDLESRVKSKRAVEARLLEFMNNANKTGDLLKISSDLAQVQEEIEVIVGKMKYLENQTSYSTIDIYMIEKSVRIPGIDNENLDTWEKTKKQLASSINFLLAAGSELIVFFIGNLPVIVILLLVGAGIYFMIKRKKKRD